MFRVGWAHSAGLIRKLKDGLLNKGMHLNGSKRGVSCRHVWERAIIWAQLHQSLGLFNFPNRETAVSL